MSKTIQSIPTNLIAPCGINCSLCWGYIREKNSCPGCRIIHSTESKKSKYRKTCKIKNCRQIESGKLKYCSPQCDKFPCTRLKQLDKRYRTKYGMSMIENLKMIDEKGIRYFIKNEKNKWKCYSCGDLLCIHKSSCPSCGRAN